MCMQQAMGVTIGLQEYKSVASVPPPLNLVVIDAHIEHWRKKAAIAPDRVSRAMADGHVSALQLVRVAHDLPMLPEPGEATR